MPTTSKFSSARPSGSITRWHDWHAGFGAVRLHALAHREQAAIRAPPSSPRNPARRAAAAAAAVPNSTSSTHLPRSTGEVRSATDVIVRMLPWPNRPRRFGSASATRAKRGSGDVRDAVVAREPLVHERVVGRQQVEHVAVLADDAVRRAAPFRARIASASVRVELRDRAAASGWILSRSCSRSHCDAKRVESAAARGSASMRRACCSSPAAVASVPRAAAAISSSSGSAAPEEEREPRREVVRR